MFKIGNFRSDDTKRPSKDSWILFFKRNPIPESSFMMIEVSDQWCRTTNDDTTKTTFTWTIEDFQSRPEKNGEKITSTTFLAREPNEKTTSWKLDLYPKGRKDFTEDDLSICLRSCNDFPIKARFSLSILDSSSKKTNTCDYRFKLFDRSKKETAWGRGSWVSRQSIINNTTLLPGGHLKIFCELTVINGTERPDVEIERGTNARGQAQVSEHFGKLLNNKEFSDVEIECDGEIFNCHKAVLSIRSDYFQAMFQADMAENRSNKVAIKDVDSQVVREILQFIYTGATNKNVLKEKSRELLAAANQYQLDLLKSICEDHLCSHLQIDNAIENLVFGAFHQASKLRMMAMKVIARNLVKLVGTEEYQDLVKDHPSLAAEIPKALVEDNMI